MEIMSMKTRFYKMCDITAFILLCMLMADCCVTGAGRILMLGPISLRMIIFGLMILISLPLILASFRTLFSIPVFCALCAFLMWLIVETVIGIVNGNNTFLILTDLKGFAYFALAPVAICVLQNKERVHTLMKTMMYACGVMGLVVILHFILYLWFSETFISVYYWGLGSQFSAISPISATIPRLFFRSSAYFLVGCAFPTYFQILDKRFRLQYSAITGLSLFCLLMTYTRSIYLGVIVAATVLVVGFLIFLDKQVIKQFWKHIGTSVVVMCLILTIFGVINKTEYVGFAFQRTNLSFQTGQETQATDPAIIPTESTTKPTESTTKPTESTTKPTDPITVQPDSPTSEAQRETLKSDQVRSKMHKDLLDLIKQSPIFGQGLGTALEWRPINEYFFLDITAKTGMIGLLLYLLPILLIFGQIVSNWRTNRNAKLLLIAWICVLLGFVAFSYFNPYMNAALGVLYYSCTIGVSTTIKKHKNKQIEQ